MKGIYLIKCKSEDKVYIGQSNDIKKRYRSHIQDLRKNKHPNSYLQKAFNCYGENDFSLEILYELDNETFDRNKLYELEMKYISLYNSTDRTKGFNIESGGMSSNRCSKETREKLRQSHIGKKSSLETREKLSKMRKGIPSHWKGKKQSEEHSRKRTEQQIGKVWVNNGKESKFVTKEIANELLQNGFCIGRPFFNRVKGKKYYYNGNLYTISQISNMCGIERATLSYRINAGWSIERATTEPIKK